MIGRCGIGATVRNERGSILLATLMGVLVITFLGVALMEARVVEERLVAANNWLAQAFFMAESGINRTMLNWSPDGIWGDPTNPSSFNTINLAGGATTTLTLTNPTALGGLAGYQNSAASWTHLLTAHRSTLNAANVTLTSSACPPASGPSASRPCVTVQTDIAKGPFTLYPFYADTSMNIGLGVVDSFDSRTGTYNPISKTWSNQCTGMACGANLWTNGSLATDSFNATTVYGSIWAARGSINIGNSTTMWGDVAWDSGDGSCTAGGGSCVGSGQIKGTGTPTSGLDPISVPKPARCTTWYVPSGWVSGNGVDAPGSGLHKESGAGNPTYNPSTGVLTVSGATLRIDAGTYCFSSITVSFGGVVHVQSGNRVVAKVSGLANFTGGAVTNDSRSAANFQLISSYGQLGGETGTGVTLSGSTDGFYYVYAPDTPINVNGGGGNIFGALVGKSLTSTTGARLHFDQALSVPGAGLVQAFGVIRQVPGTWKRCLSTVGDAECP